MSLWEMLLNDEMPPVEGFINIINSRTEKG
jgi:hypothetical protein